MAGTIHEIRKYRLHRRRAQLKFTKKSAHLTGSSKLEVPTYVCVSHTGNLLAFFANLQSTKNLRIAPAVRNLKYQRTSAFLIAAICLLFCEFTEHKKSAHLIGSSKLEVPAYVCVSHSGNLAFLRIYRARKKSANRTGSSKLEVPAYVCVSHSGNLLAFLRICDVSGRDGQFKRGGEQKTSAQR